jgi:hypothetical protein
MKKQSRKLNLNRETLIPLTPDILDEINGGITPTLATITGPSVPGPSRSQASMCWPRPSLPSMPGPTQTRILCDTSQVSVPQTK